MGIKIAQIEIRTVDDLLIVLMWPKKQRAARFVAYPNSCFRLYFAHRFLSSAAGAASEDLRNLSQKKAGHKSRLTLRGIFSLQILGRKLGFLLLMKGGQHGGFLVHRFQLGGSEQQFRRQFRATIAARFHPAVVNHAVAFGAMVAHGNLTRRLCFDERRLSIVWQMNLPRFNELPWRISIGR
jgi:hypothetical protein